jgi:rubrerythrin
MEIFEFAMKMEKDGEAYYEKMAKMTDNAVLKNILVDLAQDEVKHYNIFKRFKEGDLSSTVDLKGSASKVMDRAKNVFEQLAAKKTNFSFGNDVVAAWKEAQKIEKKSEDFYREKAADESNDKVKKTFLLIADEEHKHWTLIEHVLQFLNHPRQWIDDAEWNNLEK